MAGGNLELFKFGFYVMFPIGSMYYFGSPDFFEKYVKNLKFWPEQEKTNRPPVERQDVKNALEELRKDRLAKKAAREQREQMSEQAAQ